MLDEAGARRKHMTVFVDGTQVSDRKNLSDPVKASSEINVIQSVRRITSLPLIRLVEG